MANETHNVTQLGPGSFRIVRADHEAGGFASVTFALDPALTQAQSLRAQAADLRVRATRLLRLAEDADACAIEAERLDALTSSELRAEFGLSPRTK